MLNITISDDGTQFKVFYQDDNGSEPVDVTSEFELHNLEVRFDDQPGEVVDGFHIGKRGPDGK